jgi:hypothetical protein
MSAKRDPDEEDGDFEEEEEDYLDDDDDDEEDFQPGDDDDDEDEDDSSKVVPLLDGTLSLDEEQKLHYKGDGFHLQSVTAVQWNLLDKAVKPESDSYTLEMVGSCDVLDYDTNEGDRTTSNSRKPTPRTVQVTWTVAPNTLSSSAAASNGKSRTKKSADDEKDEDDGKMPSVFYLIHGREMNGMNRLEFKGGYLPTDGKQLKLLTEIRTVSQTQPQPAAAAAAHIDNDDDDDNINDIDDDGVDCDELIALHEDAGLSVDALRKRYRNTATTANSNDGDDEEATTAVSSKKRKGKPTPAAEEEEEEQGDDDDDIAF